MRQGKGFTLIELLVVVAIIVVLISVLMPSLQNAREQAKSVKCMSNLRQSGYGLMMYAQENQGFMVIKAYGVGDGDIAWRGWHNILAKYGQIKGAMSTLCPAGAIPANYDPSAKDFSGTNVNYNYSRYYQYAYGMRMFGTGVVASLQPCFRYSTATPSNGAAAIWLNTKAITVPSTWVMLGDSSVTRYSTADTQRATITMYESWNSDELKARHNDGKVFNIAYLDGHVESINRIPLEVTGGLQVDTETRKSGEWGNKVRRWYYGTGNAYFAP